MRIAVLGCGRWGSFLAWYLCRTGHEVTLYGRAASWRMERLLKYRENDLLQIPEGVQLTTDLAAANDVNLLDERAVDREHTLNANTVRGAADGEGLRDAAMLLGNNGALKSLDTLLVAFLDADGDANGVADFELGLVLFDHTLGKMLHCVHGLNSSILLRRSYTIVRQRTACIMMCHYPADGSAALTL